MCEKEKERRKQGLYKKKKQQWATTPLLFFILLHNLEADTQRMRMLIPIGTKQYELANLSC